MMRFWDIFSLANRHQRRLASLQRRPDVKSLYSSFLIHSCGSVVPVYSSFSVHSIRRNDQKSAPARGDGWALWRLRPNGSGELRVPGCGNAASNSKTDIEPAIFPKSLRSCVLKNALKDLDRFAVGAACAGFRKHNVRETKSHWGSAQESIPVRSRSGHVPDRQHGQCRAP